MESIRVNKFLRLLTPLSMEEKLEILSKLSAKLKSDLSSNRNNDKNLLNELYGSWKNTDDKLASQILESRSTSNKQITFD